jgi:sugar/nucleoside kinase (ribokinase family)
MNNADSLPGRTASPRLLAIGGAHIDRLGIMTSPFVAGASIPGQMKEDVGGACFNALANAARFDIAVSLVSLRGGDAAGERVALALARHGISDLASVFLDRVTPSYTALVAPDGNIIAALADMDLYDRAFARETRRAKLRRAISSNDALLVDANLPSEAIAQCMALAGGKPVFAMAISPAKVQRLAASASGMAMLFMNRREAAALVHDPDLIHCSPQRLLETMARAGLANIVVTDGANPVAMAVDGCHWTADVPILESLTDATGAGDALTGTMIAALMSGQAPESALRTGITASALTVSAPTSIADWTENEFSQMIEQCPPPRPL